MLRQYACWAEIITQGDKEPTNRYHLHLLDGEVEKMLEDPPEKPERCQYDASRGAEPGFRSPFDRP